MKRHRRDYEMMADMNLTNLLDTAFVLLIAFIMASPTMRPGLNINLPEIDPNNQVQQHPQSQPVEISIRKMKDLPDQPEWIFFNSENRVELSELGGLLEKMKPLDPAKKLDVLISMDKDGRYDVFAKVVAILREHQIDSVGLPMAPEDMSQAEAQAASDAKKSETGKEQKKTTP